MSVISWRMGRAGAAWTLAIAVVLVGLALCGVGEASRVATQTLRMSVTGASVFDMPASSASVRLGVPLGSMASLASSYVIVGPAGGKTIITAGWDKNDMAPGGCRLRLDLDGTAPNPRAQSEGIVVSSVARRVLTLTGSSFAGPSAPGAPHFKYSLEVEDAAAPSGAGPQAVTVTLTLTEAS